jgi:predicted DNA-binding protein
MPEKTTRLTILIDSPTKQRLETLSEEVDLTISQVIRKLIRDHLQQYESQINPAMIEQAREDSSTYS